jgi:hypothetical protein
MYCLMHPPYIVHSQHSSRIIHIALFVSFTLELQCIWNGHGALVAIKSRINGKIMQLICDADLCQASIWQFYLI